jgi:hypothetical protein
MLNFGKKAVISDTILGIIPKGKVHLIEKVYNGHSVI